MLTLIALIELGLLLAYLHLLFRITQLVEMPDDPLWNGDRRALNHTMIRWMAIIVVTCLLLAFALSMSQTVDSSYPSLRPFVFGVTLLGALAFWPVRRRVAVLGKAIHAAPGAH